jgi:hypothetical protein
MENQPIAAEQNLERKNNMVRKILTISVVFMFGVAAGRFGMPGRHISPSSQDVVFAQTQKPVAMLHLFTGPDKQTHGEEIPVSFTGGIFNMLPVSRAELHNSRPGEVIDWHPAPRRQYVITLRGHSEIEVADGKKFQVGPGSIDFVEDLTGKGHITRIVGDEDRLAIWLPIAENTAPPVPGQ